MIIVNGVLRYGFRAVGESIRYCLDQKDGQMAAVKPKKKEKKGRKQEKDKSYSDCSQSQSMNIEIYNDVKRKGRKESSNLVSKNRAEPCNNARSDESCDFEVLSEDDVFNRCHNHPQ